MDQVTRASAGKYRCIVDNGVGPALNKDFVLQVLCKLKLLLVS